MYLFTRPLIIVPETRHATTNPAEELLSKIGVDKEYDEVSIEQCAEHFVNSDFGELLYTSRHIRHRGFNEPRRLPNIGEYGYIDRDEEGERFVSLGHIRDVLPYLATSILSAVSKRERDQMATSVNHTVVVPGGVARSVSR